MLISNFLHIKRIARLPLAWVFGQGHAHGVIGVKRLPLSVDVFFENDLIKCWNTDIIARDARVKN